MKIEYLPNREVTLVYCCPPPGQYGLEATPGRISLWDHCREQFAAKFDEKVEGFYFSHRQSEAPRVIHFLRKFERILKSSGFAKNLTYTQFAKTPNEFILYVQPSMFWRECYFRRSLYTILLRCGLNYDIKGDNFDEALFDVHYKESNYLAETRSAVIRFMFGFTHYNGFPPVTVGTTVIKHGWHQEFHRLDDAAVRQRLVLPPGLKKRPNPVAVESLWS